MLAGGLRKELAAIRATYDHADRDRRALEHCDTPAAAPACKVELRYIYQVLRGLPPPTEFAQLLLGFELATTDPRIVGINLVPP